MKTSALISVAASCGVLAAAGAGVTSWAVLTAGQNAAISAASQVAGDDDVFVGDELNALLFTDAQVAAFGITSTIDSVSADYGTAPFEAPLPCSILMGQTPMSPAGVRSIEIGAQGGLLFRQAVVQFPTVEDAEAEFASVLEGSSQCATFTDDFGATNTWTSAVVSERPDVIGGFAGWEDGINAVVVIGHTSNAVSYVYAYPPASSLSVEDLASAISGATAEQLGG